MQSINSHLMRVGMISEQSNKAHPLNMRNMTVLLILIAFLACSVMYLIFEPKTLKDYTDSIFLFITVLTVALNFAYVTWKMAEIFRFTKSLEDVINTSNPPSKLNIHSIFFRNFSH